MTVETNPNYWDCECETNFIHAKAQTLACSLCGMTEDESPDSRVNEIKELVIKQTCFYKVKVNADDIKNDRVLENINTHPIALCENSELQDINTEVMENEDA